VTALLARWKAGDEGALDQLLPLVYDALRRLAARQLRDERAGHTLQPTALVHEAYLRIVGSDPGRVENRVHFLALAAKAMRRILIDHARRRAAEKRAGDLHRVTLTDVLADSREDDQRQVDAIALDDALQRLETIRPRAAQVVELRYFGGLTLDETAEVLSVTAKTVSRQWNTARLWLLDRMSSAGA
jgi:RNA polymerase sigma factor (TIGR02999 family)